MARAPRIRRGQRLWACKFAVPEAEQDPNKLKLNPNGVITKINWHDQLVYVSFHGGNVEEFTFDELEGNWTDKFQGGWWLEYYR